MKLKIYFFLLLPVFSLFTACNTGEGLGGSSAVEGYIYNVVHYDDSFVFKTDTFPAVREDVYLIFGDNSSEFYGRDIETDKNGLYRFDYLRKGNYIVYACFDHPDGRKLAESQTVKVSGHLSKAEPIYIHSGKAYGTAMVRGKVKATYYHNGSYRDEGPGIGMRAYIRHAGETEFFDDVRVGDGTFMFQKLLPGEYEVAVESEDKNTEKVSLVIQSIILTEAGKIYEIQEVYHVVNCV